MSRTTRTYALLQVSASTYAEVRAKLVAAGYEHAFHVDERGETIDMHGIALLGAADSPSPVTDAGKPCEFGGEE